MAEKKYTVLVVDDIENIVELVTEIIEMYQDTIEVPIDTLSANQGDKSLAMVDEIYGKGDTVPLCF